MFDPPHEGHLAVAGHAARQLDCEVVINPAGVPVHRPASVTDRGPLREMIAAAFGDYRIDWTEFDSPVPVATVATLERLTRQMPGQWYLILGSDQDVTAWRESERLLEMVTLCVAPRAGFPVDADRLPHGAVVLDMPAIELSSSLVRERLRKGDATGIPERIAPLALRIWRQ
jgi:nicotinate-nucleotide adenylyltransferase